MRFVITLCLLGAISAPWQTACAQEKTADKPKPEQRETPTVTPAIPVKVQILFTEMDGDKKIASMPYSFLALADPRITAPYGPSTTSLRTGVRVPIEVDGKDQKTQYIDIGADIDCGVRPEEDGRFHVYLSFDRSALFPNKSAEGERLVIEPNGQPLLRNFRISESVLVRDGQSAENITSTDPLTGHVLKLSITVNTVK